MKSKSLAAVSLLGLVGFALGQGTSVYTPTKRIEEQGIGLMGWGSGTISETDEAKFEGSWSLRITTRNLFQGGLIRLSKPVDLSGQFADKNNLLRIALRAPETAMLISSGGGGKPGGGGAGVGDAGGALKGGGKGGPESGGQGRGLGTTTSSTAPALKTLRFVITTTDGLKSEAYVPIATSGSGERGWKTVALPLVAIRGLDRTNKIVKEIGVSGDSLAIFYIGEMRVFSDTTPISGEVNFKSMNLALGDERELRATGYGGASVLRYTWDFDSKDGIQVDAEGQVIKKKFRRPGAYTITLTISDAAGLKKPYTTTAQVTVNP